ncbi:TlpA disulfide reductase family protein [Vulcanimicrobium alpinum]|uniref:TlpA family protein disulfide reductase n=1 Tax=Vulcanimicrobium alpinum TaxID=3016050 RepID=UPI00295E62AB|nr:TlpA disulfide reductase family protein [Vulcanimicrobium alpinum]
MRFLPIAAAAALAFIPLTALAVPQKGQPAPAFALKSPDGKPVTLASVKGKPVYLNFYASWCGPCNAEAPSIKRLRAKYAPRGLQVLGIDELDAPGQAVAFQKKYDNPYGVVAVDESGEVGKTYGAIAMPVHVFINRRGVVRTYRLGEMNPVEIETAIKDALK